MKNIILTIMAVALVTLGLQAQTNTFPTSGNVGIGTTSPTVKFEVLKSEVRGDEDLARFSVSDAPEDYLKITNATKLDNQFMPSINGFHVSDDRAALTISGVTESSNDRGNWALLRFLARLEPNDFIRNRPLFQWNNYTDIKMVMDAEGRLGIGTTEPDDVLEVEGGITATGLDRGTNNNAWGSLSGKENRTIIASRFNGIDDALHGFGVVSEQHYESPYIYGYNRPGNMFVLGSVDVSDRNPATGMSPKFVVDLNNGNVGIGTTTPDELLTVKGKIHAQEVIVDLQGAVAPDYVFEKYYEGSSELDPSYRFASLEEIETYTREHHHLPGMPSAVQIAEEGYELGEMNRVLLEKVEELTLLLIEQNKLNAEQQEQIEALQATLR